MLSCSMVCNRMCGSVRGYHASKRSLGTLWIRRICCYFSSFSYLTVTDKYYALSLFFNNDRGLPFGNILWHLLAFVCRCAFKHSLIHSSSGQPAEGAPYLFAQWCTIGIGTCREPYGGVAPCSPYKIRGVCGYVYGHHASKRSLGHLTLPSYALSSFFNNNKGPLSGNILWPLMTFVCRCAFKGKSIQIIILYPPKRSLDLPPLAGP